MENIKQYLKKQLNPQQYEWAVRTKTSSLIIAGAGSGKTRTLTYKIGYLIFWKNVNPQNILAVTFTNKAASEMKERLFQISKELEEYKSSSTNSTEWEEDFDNIISSAITETNDKNPITPSSFKRIGTFHSIFLKILKEDIEKLDMKYNKYFWIYDEWESLSVIKTALSELKLKDKLEAKETKRYISNLKSKGITYQKFLNILQNDYEELIWKVYERYQKQMENSNSLDFDDLLLLPLILFRKDEECLNKRKNRFKYILVDEAQDSNQIQFELIKILSWEETNITFIGDDFQSIYWWRWAVMENFLNLSRRWPDINQFKLEINYRSKPHIIQAWNSIISQNQNQYQKTLKSNKKWEDYIRIFSYRDETEEAINTIELIKKLKEEKNISRNDFAILYRTNAQSQPVEQNLITEGLPYKIWGGFKFFERKEVKDILSYIKYIINPKDSVGLKRIINIPNRKIWATTLSNIESYADSNSQNLNEIIKNIEKIPVKITSSASKNIQQFNTIIRFLVNQIEDKTPSEIIKNITSCIGYKDYLIKFENQNKAEERMENIWQLINMASKYDKKWTEWLIEFMEEISIMTDIEAQWTSSDAINLMTIHASKWLEFPVIFIIGLEDNIFPLSKAKFDERELEEERRLMYVAITRAEEALFLSHANSRQQWWQIKYNAPSRFLWELPEELSKKYDLWNYSNSSSRKKEYNLEEWDTVRHKLFGEGKILEIWDEIAIIKFFNSKYWMKKLDCRFLEKI